MKEEESKKYLHRVPILIIILIVSGTLGYMIIEGWSPLDSLYMVIITLSTIGYGEVYKLSTAGRLFTIFLIIGGLGIIAYTFRWFSEYILEGRLRGSLMKRQIEKKIKKLKDHYIICGCGRVGRQIAEEFASERIPFVITDRNPEHLKRAELAGWLFLPGDADSEEILKRAGVERARSLLTVVDDDADNVFITLTARSLNPDLFIVARASYEENISKLYRAGADRVATPHKIGGYHMAAMALRPAVVDFLDTIISSKAQNLSIEDIELKSARLVGKSLREALLRKREKITVLAINRKKGFSLISPDPETTLHQGDRLIVMGRKDDLERIKNALE